jgi:geranylgeranyl pyrophosphate synthase
MTRLDARIRAYWARIEQVLDRCLVLPEPGSARLRDAMRYRTLGRGKRLRPLLLSVEGHAQLLGNSIGADAVCQKSTYPSTGRA